MPYSIYHDLVIKAPISQIFKSITSPVELMNWWPKKCSGKPDINEEYNFYFSPEYDWYGKVSKMEKDKSFHIKMTEADEDWNPTTFGFDLEPQNENTLVKFSHTNWPECNHHFRTASFCWAILLNDLKNYVENGIIIPFEERE